MNEQRGSRVAGSRFFRDFCAECGEAIRVSVVAMANKKNYCEECSGEKTRLKVAAGIPKRFQEGR